MRYCKHTQWLGLAANDGDILLQNTDRLQTLLEDLPDPDEQSPSLLVFIGNRSKAMAVKELAKTFSPPPRYGRDSSRQNYDKQSWSQTKISGRRANGEIHLHIHAPSTFSKRPVLLAEGDLPSIDKQKVLAIEQCHETTSRPLLAGTPAVPTFSEAADRTYFRLLSPFTDVFCFFADDLGQLQPVVKRLALWLDLGQPSYLPKSTRPKVLVVVERGGEFHGDDESASISFKQMLSEETTIDIADQFSDIRILSLAARNTDLSNRARHRELFEQLLNFSDQVREAKVRTQTLFSAHHTAAFFHNALTHVAATSVEPFNFIANSRIENPVASDLQDHLVEFLHRIKTPQSLLQFAIPIIASSFLLDNYPPDMHLFCPREVFCTLYKGICHRVCRTGVLAHEGSTHMILPSGFIRLLEDEFVTQVEAFIKLLDVSSAIWHRRMLCTTKTNWFSIRSKTTCLVCLRARPQYRLPCGHIICDNCVRLHGEKKDIWDFHVPHCFLCGLETSGAIFKVRPPTATARLLCIDGGGVRGIIPLIVLQALEELVGLPYPVQGNFDFIFGTSAGGIIALALSHTGLSVGDCIALYERLAKKAFGLHLVSYLAIIISLFTDGIYPTQNLDAALQEVFGSNERILDCSSATAMGTRIGVVASTMKPEPFLFTNYNGLGDRDDKKFEKYGVLLGDALVWEIARSTSAAPGFFTPKRIAGLGKFQDGGLTHNNPYQLALKELKAMFPHDPSAKRSALKVSLGTGKAPDYEPELHGSNSWWRDMWLFRLARALWSAIDGQDNGDAIRRMEANNQQDVRKAGKRPRQGEYFRFNVEFHDRQPRLDDSSKMPEMKSLAQEAMLHSKQLKRLAHCVIAELFVFMLESIPRKENGKYSCTGHILCRYRAKTLELEALLEKLAKSSAKFLLRGRTLPGSVGDRSSLDKDGNFRKRVCFDVNSKEDFFSLHLRETGPESQNISGSPFSVNWLVQEQRLGWAFGRPDGVQTKWKDNDEGPPKKRQRQ
ncbi:patatin-like phospholipase-like protein [Rhexocercosporidium sp. MPI-PUGE-AT-0058]|nr:patatin-like phospholipase-like protein [Rhexocercosporidium sp. MPI-PUGE-AT-0058]